MYWNPKKLIIFFFKDNLYKSKINNNNIKKQ